MRVEVDVSDLTIKEVLSMCEDQKQRLVAYISKSLNKAKRNYEIHDKEMLAIIRCLEAQRHFLEGTRDQFEIWTNHKNLEYFIKTQKLNQRQARQLLYLSRFDFALKYIAGKSMGQADSLNKKANWVEEVERDIENQIMLKKEWLEMRAMKKEQLLIERSKEEIIEKIKKSEAKDDEVVKAVKKMKKARVKILRNKLMLKEGKIYVLKDEKLRLEIIQLYHVTPIAGYRRQQKTVELVTKNYQQLEVTKEVKQYVKRCDQCQRIKNRAEIPAEKLRPNAIL